MTPRMAAKLNGTEIQAATEAIKIARGVGSRKGAAWCRGGRVAFPGPEVRHGVEVGRAGFVDTFKKSISQPQFFLVYGCPGGLSWAGSAAWRRGGPGGPFWTGSAAWRRGLVSCGKKSWLKGSLFKSVIILWT